MNARVSLGLLVILLFGGAAPAGLYQPVPEPLPVRFAYARAGDPGDELNVGMAYLKGEGVEKDPKQAVEWFRRSAAHGFPNAQLALAICLEQGTGTPVDLKEAFKWFRAAARQGNFKAQLLLMSAYAEGKGGVERSAREALTWDFLARRTLELEEEQKVEPPPHPPAARADGAISKGKAGDREDWLRLDGSIESDYPDGKKTIQDKQGNVEEIAPDGRRVIRGAKGRVETILPDGSRTVEGEGISKEGQVVHLMETYDIAGQRLIQRVTDAEHTVELHADGSAVVEFPGVDEHGNAVTLFERFDTSRKLAGRELVRLDGTKPGPGEDWIITRWQVEGLHRVKVTERYALGTMLLSQTVHPETGFDVSLASKPLATAPTAPSAPPPTGPPQMLRSFTPASAPPPQDSQEWVQKPKRDLSPQLALLQKVEEATHHFAGATEKDYEQARAAAGEFLITLQGAPQKPGSTDLTAPRPRKLSIAEVPVPRRVEVPDDRTSLYPLGMYGREAIGLRPWKHAETDHFVVHYEESSDAAPIIRYIEAAYYVVTHTLGVEDGAEKRKSHVFVFPGAYWSIWRSKHDLPPQVAGYAFKDELLVGTGETRDEYVKTVCHEATHAIVARFYPSRPLPLWLNEGFAEYMGARSLGFQRGKTVERFLRPNADATIDLPALLGCINAGISRTFYADSEKTVRCLLERLPPASFPHFINLIAAGNAPEEALKGAYGKACPSVSALSAMVGSLTTLEPSEFQRLRR